VDFGAIAGPLIAGPADIAVPDAGAGAAAAGAAAAVVPEADLFTPPWPEQAPRPLCVEVVPSLQIVTGPPPDPDEDAAAVAAGAGAAGAAALPALPAEADLFTPPWPEQAPRPLCVEVVPSLQVTVPEPDAADDAEVAAPAAGAGAASEPEAEALAPADADLSIPPCPEQAPRPPWGEVVPSLQVTEPLVALEVCAEETTGPASSAAANIAPHIKPLNFAIFICSSP
jgi:hypothetical protein